MTAADSTPTPEQPTAPRSYDDDFEEMLKGFDRIIHDKDLQQQLLDAGFLVRVNPEAEAAASVPAPEQDDRLRFHPLTGDADFEEASLSDRLDTIISHARSEGFGEGYRAALATPPPVPAAPPCGICHRPGHNPESCPAAEWGTLGAEQDEAVRRPIEHMPQLCNCWCRACESAPGAATPPPVPAAHGVVVQQPEQPADAAAPRGETNQADPGDDSGPLRPPVPAAPGWHYHSDNNCPHVDAVPAAPGLDVERLRRALFTEFRRSFWGREEGWARQVSRIVADNVAPEYARLSSPEASSEGGSDG